MRSKLRVKGKVRIVHKDGAGNILEDRVEDNLIVNLGLAFLASRAIGVSDDVMSHMAVGIGSTAPIGADTTLESEVGRTALASATALNGVITYVASFNPGVGTGALTEVGIFNAGIAGTMLNRLVFSVVNKAASDTVEITWTVSFIDDGV